MRGTGGDISHLNFDCTLHHHDVWYNEPIGLHLPAREGFTLFQHMFVLEELIAPYPHVQILPSTSWTHRLGLAKTKRQLSAALQARVIGHCKHEQRGIGDVLSGAQVSCDVERRKPRARVALDDDNRGRTVRQQEHLVFNGPGA